jgi:hypothetical protein
MNALVVPTLAIDGVRAKHLQSAALELGRKGPNHSRILILKEPSLGRGKHKQRRPTVSEDQRFHIAMKFLAICSVMFAVHFVGRPNDEVSYLIP